MESNNNDLNAFRHMTANEHTLLVVSAPDLEKAVWNVVTKLLDQKEQERIVMEQSRKDAKIKRDVACERLKKEQSTLFRWERAGMLHPIKIGRTVYYLESEIRVIEEGRL